MATYNNIKKIKIGDNIFNLYDSGNSGGTITSVKTTAGAHTAVNVTSGAVSFNVPTKTSDLTNDSDFISRAMLSISFTGGTNSFDYSFTTTAGIVSDSVTITPSITKAMVTTALGTGSGTTKFLREDGSWAKPAYIANTDEKLKIAAVTSGTQYYPIVAANSTAAANRQYDSTGFKYKGTNGTTSAVGSSILELGNNTASGTANNKQAQLVMYGSNAKKATITLAAPSADIALALPTSGGTLALTSQIPTTLPASDVYSWAKASTKPTYTASEVGAVPTTRTVNGHELSADIADADYVVAIGTDNGFTYRKWSSGALDAERVWNIGQYTVNTAYGTGLRVGGEVTISQPSNMTSGSIEVTLLGNSSNSPIFLEHISATKFRIVKVSATNVTLNNVTLALRLINGRWD